MYVTLYYSYYSCQYKSNIENIMMKEHFSLASIVFFECAFRVFCTVFFVADKYFFYKRAYDNCDYGILLCEN